MAILHESHDAHVGFFPGFVQLVYFIGVGGIVHFLWLVKSDLREPLIYGAILAVLPGFRLWHRARREPADIAGTARQALPWPDRGACAF